MGNYSLGPDKETISLIVDKIFTNCESVNDKEIQVIKMKLGRNKLYFEKDSFMNRIVIMEGTVVLNLHTNYKNKSK